MRFVVGTSGYSFADWVGTFYAEGTNRRDMFSLYAKRFETVELNYTFYRMPTAKTLAAIAAKSPPGFSFWVKANQQITHEGALSLTEEFLENLAPLREADKLAGVLGQFPQSFHRTVSNRKLLADLAERLASAAPAVEFRHASWDHPATLRGLRDRGVTLVVPDVPAIPALFRHAPVATTRTGYLRLHSRDAGKWYNGERYDYSYGPAEMQKIIEEWRALGEQVDTVQVFFNNCHRGQAAQNAEAFRRLLEQV